MGCGKTGFRHKIVRIGCLYEVAYRLSLGTKIEDLE